MPPETKHPFANDLAVGLLGEVRDAIKENTAVLRELLQMRKSANRAPNSEATVTDADLDSERGDEKIKMNPRNWSGQSFKGQPMSQCPAEFLDQYAESMAYFAQKNDEKGEKDSKGGPKSKWDRLSEGRARGWAARIRAGKVKQEPAKPEGWQAEGGGW